ncbi:MAG: hypothetical protein ACREIR_03405 [Geminicoccaceae bacterium]
MSHPTSATGRGWSTTQLAWGCIGSFVAGAVLLYAAGFHWIGQWQTGEEVAQKVAVAGCVQEFLLQPDRGVIYTELKNNSSSYQRRQLIQKNKWAVNRDVAGLCDQQIQSFDPLRLTPSEPVEEAAEARQPA